MTSIIRFIPKILLEGYTIQRYTKNTLLSMKGKVPTVLDINVGIDLLHSERSYDIILEVILESMEHLEIYQKDLYHCTVVKPLMHEIRCASVAIDFEVE